MVKYDVLIIGAGAAGLTAAVYTCRKQLKTLIVSVDVGGQTNLTSHIENYPGVDAMPGPKLMDKFRENAVGFGAVLVNGKVVSVDKSKFGFKVGLSDGEFFETKTLILAFGKVAKSLNIPGEEKFFGRGVSTCAICDAPLYRNKVALVVGGGNAGFEAAEDLSKVAKKVFLVHRSESFKADEITVSKVRKIKNVELVLNTVLKEIKGDKFVTGVSVENVKSKKKKDISVDGVFVEIGSIVDTSFVKHLVKTNDLNEVIVNDVGETSCKGIFAAGDVTQVPFKQTVISAGDGAKAALQLHRFLTGNNKRSVDW